MQCSTKSWIKLGLAFNKLSFAFLLLFGMGCHTTPLNEKFQGNLLINDSLAIPFDIQFNPITRTYSVHNGQEVIRELIHSKVNDSTDIEHPVYNSSLRFVRDGDTLKGFWYNREKGNYQMPFRAYKNFLRVAYTDPAFDPSGRWAVWFSNKPRELAIGLFEMEQEQVSGTFLTETGDYHYMQGAISGDQLIISTFNFSDAYLFQAQIQAKRMKGMFYSGKHHQAAWNAVRDDQAVLKGKVPQVVVPDSLVQFFITGLSGEPMSKDHPLFQDKPFVIQLFGSWCPNCYDESKYLNRLHREYQDKIVIMGVGFERVNGFAEAQTKIEKFRKGLGITYSLSYGGPSNRDSAQAHFPFLDEVIAYPTLLFFDREHQLVAVHSGFTGPGAGKEYLKTKKKIRQQFEQLIAQ